MSADRIDPNEPENLLITFVYSGAPATKNVVLFSQLTEMERSRTASLNSIFRGAGVPEPPIARTEARATRSAVSPRRVRPILCPTLLHTRHAEVQMQHSPEIDLSGMNLRA